MGTRNKKPDPRSFETNSEYTLASATPELERLSAWKPDPTLFNAGTQAAFGQRTRDIKEGYGGYSGINNPVLRARMEDLALGEAAGQRASALGDQDLAYQRLSLEPIQAAAAIRQGDRLKTKEWGYGQQPEKQGGGIGSTLLQGGLSILGGLI